MHRIGNRVEIGLVGFIMLIRLLALDIRGRHRSHEHFLRPARLGRRLDVGNVALQRLLSAVFHRPGANELYRFGDQAFARLAMRVVKFGECDCFA